MAAPDTSSSLDFALSANAIAKPGAIRIDPPRNETPKPLLFASPHSGQDYPDAFARQACLDLLTLRRSEDAFVDELVDQAPHYGATLLRALFPRVYVDPNRGPWELDPGMFADRLPSEVEGVSRRASSGLGVIPRVGVEGRPLYRSRMRYAEARERLDACYTPYHSALSGLIDDIRTRFGQAVVIDMHSMPAQSARDVDFVIGDRFGSACDPALTERVEALLTGMGYVAVRNIPYAGGYTTEHYGRPLDGVHVVQIEINRSLYMDEGRVVKLPEFDRFKSKMSHLISGLCETDWSGLLSS
ncbi:N-formylglutamate amidohydrolase [Maricaulis parjimensis]|uniref:N-formylglutamate amidohydrolase n=1 Tax=Maricaulis parjimensis TaxID=144023 RepID=UPI001939E01F|nr:N-formylglutamate amidohydrolase [Maricaulis parjimensis]